MTDWPGATPQSQAEPPDSKRPTWLLWAVIIGLLVLIAVLLVILVIDDDSGDSGGSTSGGAATTAATTAAPAAGTDAPQDSSSNGNPCPEFTEVDELPLQLCDSGDFVNMAQGALVNWGASIDVDGFFGEATDAAVRAFQADQSLEVDGIIGQDTWAALCPFSDNALCEPDGG